MAILDWAMMALSLANTIILLWLSSMVLLIAERRTWGIWLMSGGMFAATLFYVSHTAILGNGIRSEAPIMTFWWHLGLMTVTSLPFAWYVILLWYVGYWRGSSIRRRHRASLAVSVLLSISLVGLLIFANPFPSYSQVIDLRLSETPTLVGVPILIVVYMLGTLLNMAFSLDVLNYPSQHNLPDQMARQQAKRWLALICGVLLAVSLLVIAVMLWVIGNAQQFAAGIHDDSMVLKISVLDLIISGCVTAVIVLTGQTIVRFEAFTGKLLPQQRFRRHWQNVVVLALGYGIAMGIGVQLGWHSVYSLLVMAILITLFYALFCRNSYIQHKHYMDRLRPFVSSQKVYDHLTENPLPAEIDLSIPFTALCNDVLGAQLAFLIPIGPLAPLIGNGIAYPKHRPVSAGAKHELVLQLNRPELLLLPLDPEHYDGAVWAISLWSDRGLIGVLLLGPKCHGALYTQEEIEIARSSSERLIDTQASAEIARRLMALQRQRLAESQVIDRQTRRMLHDDILPQIHTAMLTLSAGQTISEAQSEAQSKAIGILADVHLQVSDLLHQMPKQIDSALVHSDLFTALRRTIGDELQHAFDQVEWDVQVEAMQEAKRLPPLVAEVLFYAAREAIRNAARYGRGEEAAQFSRPLQLCVEAHWRTGLELSIKDNGIGFTAATPSGHGLALHSTMMAVIGGVLTVDSIPNNSTRVLLSLPRQVW